MRTDRHSVVNGEKKKSGLIRKYGLNMSRQAFREKAADMGWVKVSAFAGGGLGWG
jgi:small subunit ribosomal protein S29e